MYKMNICVSGREKREWVCVGDFKTKPYLTRCKIVILKNLLKLVTQMFTKCGCRTHFPAMSGTTCDILGHEYFMGKP